MNARLIRQYKAVRGGRRGAQRPVYDWRNYSQEFSECVRLDACGVCWLVGRSNPQTALPESAVYRRQSLRRGDTVVGGGRRRRRTGKLGSPMRPRRWTGGLAAIQVAAVQLVTACHAIWRYPAGSSSADSQRRVEVDTAARGGSDSC